MSRFFPTQSSVHVTQSYFSRGGAKQWNRDFRCRVFKRDFDWHTDFHVLRLAIDDIGQHAHAFFQFHIGHNVRQIITEASALILVGRGIRIDRALAATLDPFQIRRQIFRAKRTGVIENLSTTAAFLDVQFMPQLWKGAD